MRPVKKALRALDRPDETLSQQEQVVQTTKCLIEIGEQIDKCLLQYKDPETIKKWKRYEHNLHYITLTKVGFVYLFDCKPWVEIILI